MAESEKREHETDARAERANGDGKEGPMLMSQEHYLWEELHQIIGEACDRSRTGASVNTADCASRALVAFKRRFAQLAVGDTVTTPSARLVVRTNKHGFAQAVLELND